MEDFIKKETSDKHLSKEVFALPNKNTSWLTKNRFWNLVFLFAVPAEIFLAALMSSGWMLILPIATTIAIFGFVPTDEGTITPVAARKDPFAKAACGIFFASLLATFFAKSTIFSIFGFSEVVFFMFLIPISILCYANIPLSSCIEAQDASEMSRSSSNIFDQVNTMNYNRLSSSQDNRPENVFYKR